MFIPHNYLPRHVCMLFFNVKSYGIASYYSRSILCYFVYSTMFYWFSFVYVKDLEDGAAAPGNVEIG